MKILIVGGGSVTEELLRVIDLKRNQVVIVEKNTSRCTDISSKYDVLVINKDATDASVYTADISMSELDVVLALTDKDEVNIFTLTIAKLYRIPFRLARVRNPRVAELIRELGLGVPITSPSIIADLVRNFLESVGAPTLLAEFNEYKMYRVTISETDKVVNKKIEELNLPEDIRVILVFDGSSLKPPEKNLRLLNGYQLIVLTKSTDVLKLFKG